MPERPQAILRIICLALAALLVFQLARRVVHRDPLARLALPALPTLAAVEEPSGAHPSTNATPRPPSGPKPTQAPPAPTGAVGRIVQSEILGPVPRPPSAPMALLGIAGRDAFLRAPSGQTGLLREGSELGGLKLLRIGTNRVLVEYEGKQKELTVFSGLGSKSLVPQGKDNPQ